MITSQTSVWLILKIEPNKIPVAAVAFLLDNDRKAIPNPIATALTAEIRDSERCSFIPSSPTLIEATTENSSIPAKGDQLMNSANEAPAKPISLNVCARNDIHRATINGPIRPLMIAINVPAIKACCIKGKLNKTLASFT